MSAKSGKQANTIVASINARWPRDEGVRIYSKARRGQTARPDKRRRVFTSSPSALKNAAEQE